MQRATLEIILLRWMQKLAWMQVQVQVQVQVRVQPRLRAKRRGQRAQQQGWRLGHQASPGVGSFSVRRPA